MSVWLNGAILVACAVFVSEPLRTPLLVGLLLFLPLADSIWRPFAVPSAARNRAGWIVLLLIAVTLLAWRPQHLGFAISTLLLAALPEEWFFRAYFMTRLGSGWRANLMASLLFAVMHGLTHDGMTAALVFLPSLAYGWLYQRTRDLPLLVLIHALSNLIYVLGFGAWLDGWLIR